MIEFIEVEKIHPHKDNPRKNLGDLTELAESIKKSGIYQNLTVIPASGYHFGEYTVIIGHRRLAAAKLAGLQKVPCVVTAMDEREQIATMLLENMQRSDLTVYEQAQGIQMMLDLGDTVDEISEKTGFSESTIRRRTKLLKLDEDAFRDSQERQVTLAEYDKLFEIEDESKRNELLQEIGTGNFNNKFLEVKRIEKNEKKRAELISALSEFAEEKSDKDCRDYSYVGYISNVSEIPEEREDVPYFYSKAWGTAVYLYRDFTDEEKAEAEEDAKIRADEVLAREKMLDRIKQIDEVAKRFFNLRFEFVKNLNPKDLKDEIISFAVFASFERFAFSASMDMIDKLVGETVSKVESYRNVPDTDVLSDKIRTEPEKLLLYATYSRFHDNKENKCHVSWNGSYQKNKTLESLYNCLCDLGYEMSDEEKAYMDGTHELFLRLEDESSEE